MPTRILLREHEELSYREIASVLDCPSRTTMSLLARARTELRTLLSETMHDLEADQSEGVAHRR
jgi:DNA-directed RNA polymerase specialized sigma24 family protein